MCIESSMSSGVTSTGSKGSVERSVPHTRIQDDTMINDHYEVGDKLGEGSFGTVYAATHKTSGVKWAIKSIQKDKAGSFALRLVDREVAILKRVNHPHVIQLNEIIESPERMYMVMEMCPGGELADVLKTKQSFSEAETKQIMTQLASAISYLHKQGVVHRDLKLENILMGQSLDDAGNGLNVKVTDFGLSVVKGGVSSDSMMQDICGTPIYMAPEILDNKTYSQQCDVWAMGIIMYILLCGYPPFCATEEEFLYNLIREAKLLFDAEVWSGISEECKKCIQGMVKVNPAHRLSAAEVLNHPWITGASWDTSPHTNVLELMTLWKTELKNDDHNDAASEDVDGTSPTAESPTLTKDKKKGDTPPAGGGGGDGSKSRGTKHSANSPSPTSTGNKNHAVKHGSSSTHSTHRMSPTASNSPSPTGPSAHKHTAASNKPHTTVSSTTSKACTASTKGKKK